MLQGVALNEAGALTGRLNVEVHGDFDLPPVPAVMCTILKSISHGTKLSHGWNVEVDPAIRTRAFWHNFTGSLNEYTSIRGMDTYNGHPWQYQNMAGAAIAIMVPRSCVTDIRFVHTEKLTVEATKTDADPSDEPSTDEVEHEGGGAGGHGTGSELPPERNNNADLDELLETLRTASSFSDFESTLDDLLRLAKADGEIGLRSTLIPIGRAKHEEFSAEWPRCKERYGELLSLYNE